MKQAECHDQTNVIFGKISLVLFFYVFPLCVTFQNIRKIEGGNGLARFRVMMSDGQHTLSCKCVFLVHYSLTQLSHKYRNADLDP